MGFCDDQPDNRETGYSNVLGAGDQWIDVVISDVDFYPLVGMVAVIRVIRLVAVARGLDWLVWSEWSGWIG